MKLIPSEVLDSDDRQIGNCVDNEDKNKWWGRARKKDKDIETKRYDCKGRIQKERPVVYEEEDWAIFMDKIGVVSRLQYNRRKKENKGNSMVVRGS